MMMFVDAESVHDPLSNLKSSIVTRPFPVVSNRRPEDVERVYPLSQVVLIPMCVSNILKN
jgi:hypothetical protein